MGGEQKTRPHPPHALAALVRSSPWPSARLAIWTDTRAGTEASNKQDLARAGWCSLDHRTCGHHCSAADRFCLHSAWWGLASGGGRVGDRRSGGHLQGRRQRNLGSALDNAWAVGGTFCLAVAVSYDTEVRQWVQERSE